MSVVQCGGAPSSAPALSVVPETEHAAYSSASEDCSGECSYTSSDISAAVPVEEWFGRRRGPRGPGTAVQVLPDPDLNFGKYGCYVCHLGRMFRKHDSPAAKILACIDVAWVINVDALNPILLATQLAAYANANVVVPINVHLSGTRFDHDPLPRATPTAMLFHCGQHVAAAALPSASAADAKTYLDSLKVQPLS